MNPINRKQAAQVLVMISRSTFSKYGNDQSEALFAALFASADAETLSIIRAANVDVAHHNAREAHIAVGMADLARAKAFKAALARLDPEKFGPKSDEGDGGDDVDSGEAKA